MDELSERGGLEGRELFHSALGIGRSHIGATVNTLFLAYVGASLPLLVVLLINNQPTALIWNNEEIATEIVRTLAGSLGIVAAVPLTTFVATLLVGAAKNDEGDPAAQRRTKMLTILPVLAITLGVFVLLAATAILPRTTNPTALPTEPPFGIPEESGGAGGEWRRARRQPGAGSRRRAAPRRAWRGGPDQHRRRGGRHRERRRLADDTRRRVDVRDHPGDLHREVRLGAGSGRLGAADRGRDRGAARRGSADARVPRGGPVGDLHARHRDRGRPRGLRSSPTSTPRPPRSCSSSRSSSRRHAQHRSRCCGVGVGAAGVGRRGWPMRRVAAIPGGARCWARSVVLTAGCASTRLRGTQSQLRRRSPSPRPPSSGVSDRRRLTRRHAVAGSPPEPSPTPAQAPLAPVWYPWLPPAADVDGALEVDTFVAGLTDVAADQPGAGRRAVAVQHGRSRPVDVAADGRHGRPGARRDARSGARGRRRVVPRHASPAGDRRADGLDSPRGR